MLAFSSPLLLKSQTKMTIVMSSASAYSMAEGASAYNTSRFAVCRFTEFLDYEYHDQGLVAIAVHPGSVKTELSLKTPDYFHVILVDRVELPADTLVWLSAKRRDWLSGRFVSCNWDMKELEAMEDKIVRGNLLKFRMIV